MLKLLGASHGWHDGVRLQPLPDTLPGWTIAYLVAAADWVPRERLCALLWPQAAAAEAQHSLRMNLHRMRGVLVAWGLADALEADRRRVRLLLPSDADAFRRDVDVGEASLPYPGPLLDGLSCDGFPALGEWLQLERTALVNRWREATLKRLTRADATSDIAVTLAQYLLDLDPLDEAAVTRLLTALRAQGRGEEADRHYAQYCDRLARELGMQPSPAVRALASGAAVAQGRPAVAAPAFVGRRLELAELARLLAAPGDARLVTVVGPGGSGKSALAREVEARSPLAAVWIDVQDLTDIDAVGARIAQRTGSPWRDGPDAAAQLGAALRAVPRLLVLDNGEHLADLPAFVEGLLAAAPALRVLVTSRGPLAIAGETVLTLQGLAVPDEDSRDAEAAQAFDAVRLFALRGQSARADFDIAHHIDAVISIVEAVGGLPLAIELAAGWLRWLAPAAIARELRETVAVLEREPQADGLPARPEHRSMQAVLERTWTLLAPAERQALQALSVFEGGFSRAAAAAVAAAPLALLSALADKGLLRVDPEGRFDMHPLVSSHARQQLEADLETAERVRDLHADFFAGWCATLLPTAASESRQVVAAMQTERSNCTAAWLHAARRGKMELVAAMERAWREFFHATGTFRAGAALFQRALDAGLDGPVALGLRKTTADFLFRSWQPQRAKLLAVSALRQARRTGADHLIAACLSTIAGCELALGRPHRAARIHEQVLDRVRREDSEQEIAFAIARLAYSKAFSGEVAAARTLYQEAIDRLARLNDVQGVARALCNLGFTEMCGGDWQAAVPVLARGLQHARENGIEGVARECEFLIGCALTESGDDAAAQRRFTQVRDAFRSAGAEGFELKCDYYLARLAGRSGAFDGAANELFAAVRKARERGWRSEIPYISIFIAELMALRGDRATAQAMLNSISTAPGVNAYGKTLASAVATRVTAGESEQAMLAIAFGVLVDRIGTVESLDELARGLASS
jgi:predicted ATPase